MHVSVLGGEAFWSYSRGMGEMVPGLVLRLLYIFGEAALLLVRLLTGHFCDAVFLSWRLLALLGLVLPGLSPGLSLAEELARVCRLGALP